QCSAKVKGDSFFLNGEKEMVPDADAADTLLTVVRTSGVGGTEGISLLLIDVEDHLPMQLQSSFDETRHLAKISFDEYDVPKGNLLGEMNDGWKVLQEGLLHLNAALASMMTGSIDEIVDTIAEYANIREQFGGPIGRFQAVKHPIVDMKMELESARSLSYYAAWALENDAEDKEAAIYSARSFAMKAFIQAASHAIQLLGGIGFTEEIDCHLFLKRAKFYEHYLGYEIDFNEHIETEIGWYKIFFEWSIVMTKTELQYYSNIINGEQMTPETNKWMDSIDPATGKAWAKIPLSTESDADKACKAANGAFPEWSKLSARMRGNY